MTVNFAARLSIVSPDSFQFSDGIRLIDWSTALSSKVQPLFPALVQVIKILVGDPILAAGIIASLFGSLTIVPLYLLARDLYGSKAGWWAVALYSTNAAVYMQSAGVTANPLLVFCLLIVVRSAIRLWMAEKNYDSGSLTASVIAWSGLAALTRPEGLMLWPLAVLAVILHLFRKGGFKPIILLSLIPLLIWAAWNLRNGFEYGSEIILGADLTGVTKFYKYALNYLKEFSAQLLHLYSLAALLGLWFSIRASAKQPGLKIWHALVGYCFLTVLLTLAFHWAYVPRLLAPLVPLALILAAYGIWKISRLHILTHILSVVLVVATLGAGAALVIGLKLNLKTIGQDIRAGALTLAQVSDQNDRIVSDLPVETAYYSGREVDFYIPELARVGDLVVLHNIITNIQSEQFKLAEHFAVFKIGEASAPYVSPKDGGLPVVTDQVRMMNLSEREKPLLAEPYRTVILRLESR